MEESREKERGMTEKGGGRLIVDVFPPPTYNSLSLRGISPTCPYVPSFLLVYLLTFSQERLPELLAWKAGNMAYIINLSSRVSN